MNKGLAIVTGAGSGIGRACAEVLSLPLWPYMSEEDARLVASQVWKFYLG